MAEDDKKRSELGLGPVRKNFNIQDKLKALKAKQEIDDALPVIDPYTVKVRKLDNEITESELRDAMQIFGEITRCRIPMDEERGCNKGIGFITFKSS